MRMKVFLAAIALSMTAAAQEVNYRYCVPVNAKLITSKSGGVYLRKSPSTKAPRLMHGCMPETDDCMFMWSNAREEGFDAEYVMLHQGEIMMSLSQNSEFYKVYAGTANYNLPAYVACSVTENVQTEPVTLTDVQKMPALFSVIDKGPFAGTVLSVAENEIEGWSYIMVGNIIDGKLIFSHSKAARTSYNSKVKAIQYEEDTDEEDMNELVISYGPSKVRSIIIDNMHKKALDVSKLTAYEQSTLLKKLDAEKKPNHMEAYVKRNGKLVPVYTADILPQDNLIFKSKFMK